MHPVEAEESAALVPKMSNLAVEHLQQRSSWVHLPLPLQVDQALVAECRGSSLWHPL